MPKFFVNKGQISDDVIKIIGEDVLHISKVLRMCEGDSLTVCDGEGDDYSTIISSITKTEVTAKVISKKRCEAEPNVKVTLFQALPKQGKMEYIIQKNTELGISKIVPVYSKRCVVKPSDKSLRWQKVAIEAAKQCGRGVIPQITEVVTFDEALKQLSQCESSIMLYECETETRLKDVISGRKFSDIGILIGPEGGFEETEVQKAKSFNIQTITLGKRILRTETAGAAVLPIIMYEQGDL